MYEAAQIITIICLIITTAVCGWRFYLRLIATRQDIVVEIAILIAVILQIALGGLQLHIIKLVSKVSAPQDIVVVEKHAFANVFLHLGSLWAAKTSVNLLHLRVTHKIPEIYVWAICSLWFIILSLPVMYVMYVVACLPIDRHWDYPLHAVKECPPVSKRWDFWVHVVVDIITDIWLCAIPFTALRRITERHLRIAVTCIYGLAVVAIVATIIRAVMCATWLSVDPQKSMDYIVALTHIELTITIIIGSIPGISSTFTRKYVYGNSGPRPRSLQTWNSTAIVHTSDQTHDFHELGGSKDDLKIRGALQLSVGGESTKTDAAEDDAKSEDRIEGNGLVAATMI